MEAGGGIEKYSLVLESQAGSAVYSAGKQFPPNRCHRAVAAARDLHTGGRCQEGRLDFIHRAALASNASRDSVASSPVICLVYSSLPSKSEEAPLVFFRRAVQGAIDHGAPVVHMDVVFPSDSDPAGQLHAVIDNIQAPFAHVRLGDAS